jgi:hypothetical protein
MTGLQASRKVASRGLSADGRNIAPEEWDAKSFMTSGGKNFGVSEAQNGGRGLRLAGVSLRRI